MHRGQIMFDAVDTETGEVSRGRIDATAPAVDDVVTASDDEIVAAMRLLFERLKTVEEPSGASPLAALLARAGADPGRRSRRRDDLGGSVDADRFCALLGWEVRSRRREGET